MGKVKLLRGRNFAAVAIGWIGLQQGRSQRNSKRQSGGQTASRGWQFRWCRRTEAIASLALHSARREVNWRRSLFKLQPHSVFYPMLFSLSQFFPFVSSIAPFTISGHPVFDLWPVTCLAFSPFFSICLPFTPLLSSPSHFRFAVTWRAREKETATRH